MRHLWLVLLIAACSKSDSDHGKGSAAPADASALELARKATDERVAREAAARKAAGATYEKLARTFGTAARAIAIGGGKPCQKLEPADGRVGRSIGLELLKEVALTRHSPIRDAGGLASQDLVHAIRVPFMDTERSSRDYDPAQASAALAALERALFPLVVIRVDKFVAPVIAGKGTYKPGRATATAYFFGDPDSVPCTVAITAATEKSIKVLEIDGMDGGPDIVTARFANELLQGVQRTAGAELAKLGLLAGLEPVTPKG